MVLPIGRPWHAGSNLLDLSDPQSRPVMNNTSSQADRPSTSERYAHQFYVPIAKLPDDDRVAFFIDYCLPARSVPDPCLLPGRDTRRTHFRFGRFSRWFRLRFNQLLKGRENGCRRLNSFLGGFPGGHHVTSFRTTLVRSQSRGV